MGKKTKIVINQISNLKSRTISALSRRNAVVTAMNKARCFRMALPKVNEARALVHNHFL